MRALIVESDWLIRVLCLLPVHGWDVHKLIDLGATGGGRVYVAPTVGSARTSHVGTDGREIRFCGDGQDFSIDDDDSSNSSV